MTAEPTLPPGGERPAEGDDSDLAVTAYDLTLLKPGSEWGGQWRLKRLIRAGGFALVWLAEGDDGRRAAIKFLATATEDARLRFEREERLGRDLRGQWIPKVLDADREDVVPWIAFEYLDIPALDERIDSGGPLIGQDLVTFAWGLWDALREIHRRDIAHRDLSPRNVLFGRGGDVRIIDLGSARSKDDTCITVGGFPVSAGFAAPEQFEQRPSTGTTVDCPADIWGWAAVVYYAATGDTVLPVSDYRRWLWERRVPDLAGAERSLAGLRPALAWALQPDPDQRDPGLVQAAMPPRIVEPGQRADAGRTHLNRARLLAITVAAALVTNTCTFLVARDRSEDQPVVGSPAAGTVPASTALNVGVNGGYPAWSRYEEGIWRGFDVELARYLASELDREPVFVPLHTRDRIRALEEGRVDVVIANFSMDGVEDGAPRNERIDFAGPYFLDARGRLMWSATIPGSPAADGHTCVPQGSTADVDVGHRQAKRTFSQCIEQFFGRDANPPVTAIETDAAIVEPFIGERRELLDNYRRGAQSDEERSRVEGQLRDLEQVSLIVERDMEERYGVGLPNDSPGLCRRVTAALADFIDSHRWDDVFDSTLGSYGLDDLIDPDGPDPARRKPRATELEQCG